MHRASPRQLHRPLFPRALHRTVHDPLRVEGRSIRQVSARRSSIIFAPDQVSAQAPLAPGASSEQLYLNPGAADRTPWPMAGGTKVAGQATLLTIQGRRAKAEIVRLPGAEKT